MLKNKEIGGRRILVYYILAIVLPSIVLGILAFRGIRNDQALVEREDRRRLLGIGEQLSSRILASMDTIETAFRTAAPESPGPADVFFHDPVLDSFIAVHPGLSNLYFLKLAGNLQAYHSPFLYLPDAYIRSGLQPISPGLSKVIDGGWQDEFRTKNYDRAIAYYRAALNRVRDMGSKGVLLNVLARLYRKNGDHGAAKSTYQRIAKDFPDVRLPGGIPAGLSATREEINLLKREDNATAESAVSKLLRYLITAKWSISKAQYQNTIADVRGWLEEKPRVPEGISRQLDTLDRLAQGTDKLIGFIYLGREVERSGRAGRFFLRQQGNAWTYSLIPDQEGTWVLLYDKEKIMNDQVIPVLEKGASRIDFDWEVSDWNARTVASSMSAELTGTPIDFSFSSGLPAWTIQFFPGKKGFISSFLNTGKGVYFYIFVLIIIILAFGLVFTLNTVNQEVRLARMKSHFISTVSHEFKSPLTSIRQMAEMLDRGRVRSDDRRKAYYASMLHQSERLSHLIENILDFARMEDGRKQYHFEQGNLAGTVRDVVDTFRVQLKEQGYEIKFASDEHIPEMIFDREAIEQVMHNLLDNAVKYSGDRKKIDVHMHLRKDVVLIDVRDEGIGISKADQEKIFTRFYRAGDALTSKIKGSGIGLTIVRQIMEAHGGGITVISRPGHGSTFQLNLPKK